jgi:hypothetical protein
MGQGFVGRTDHERAWTRADPQGHTPEQICAVAAMTCEKPSDRELPISQWRQRKICRRGIRRGLVKSISQRSVGRFYK